MKPKENGDKKENDKKENDKKENDKKEKDKKEGKENIESKENEKTEKKNIQNKKDEDNLNIDFINSFNFRNTVPQESSSFAISSGVVGVNENHSEFMDNTLDYQDEPESENSISNANQNNDGISTTAGNSKS